MTAQDCGDGEDEACSVRIMCSVYAALQKIGARKLTLSEQSDMATHNRYICHCTGNRTCLGYCLISWELRIYGRNTYYKEHRD